MLLSGRTWFFEILGINLTREWLFLSELNPCKSSAKLSAASGVCGDQVLFALRISILLVGCYTKILQVWRGGLCFGLVFFLILWISVVTFQYPTMNILACAYCVWLSAVLMLLGVGMKGEYSVESNFFSAKGKKKRKQRNLALVKCVHASQCEFILAKSSL